MPISELSDPGAVISAIREHDELGRERFLEKHGFGPARRYYLVHDGRNYDSKAIAGVAYGYQYPDREPLRAAEFSGGEAHVRPVLERMGFEVRAAFDDAAAAITATDIQAIRKSRTRQRYDQLEPDEREAYERVHSALRALGELVRDSLGASQRYAVKLTSGFNPRSGVRGNLPKDLWFAVSDVDNAEEFVGMPQLFMIVSDKGVEYGFAASIHPSDFSNGEIRRRVRRAAPDIFALLPESGTDEATALANQLEQTGGWYFRSKTRLYPPHNDYPSLDAWLSFLRSPEGGREAGGSISRYLTDDQLQEGPDLADLMEQMAEVFEGTMLRMRKSQQPDAGADVQAALEDFLVRYAETKSTTAFGQHSELKDSMNSIQRGLQSLQAVRSHPNVHASWSLGAGNWAKIPWIALMDDRETTSTQRGTYCVFLFPEDMSGVYLTLNQGVTDIITDHGRPEGRQLLQERAQALRSKVRARLEARFALDGNINLQTDGGLGLDYEAATVAHLFYRRGEIPDSTQINNDLSALLAAYEDVVNTMPEVARSTSAWIFQANPKIFDIDGALASLDEMTWTVKDQAARAAVGDLVFIWRSGPGGGVVALATITERASVRESLPDEAEFTIDKESLGGARPRIVLRIDRRLPEPLLRTTIASEPRLQDLLILRFANYGTFKVSSDHAATLMRLVDEMDHQEAEPMSQGHRTWVYAPGENAEHWDEFYELGCDGHRLGRYW